MPRRRSTTCEKSKSIWKPSGTRAIWTELLEPKQNKLDFHTKILTHISFLLISSFSVIIWLITIELGIFPHVKNGFYCDDRSISQTTHGDSISAGMIIGSMFLVYPILWFCEAIIYKPVSLKSSRIGWSASMAWFWFREYIFAMILHLFVVDACKVFFGELRPHFLQTCRPDALDTCVPG